MHVRFKVCPELFTKKKPCEEMSPALLSTVGRSKLGVDLSALKTSSVYRNAGAPYEFVSFYIDLLMFLYGNPDEA